MPWTVPTIELPVQKGASNSAVGFVDLNSNFVGYEFRGTVTSPVAVAVMDAFSEKMTGTNVVVIDKALVHRSQEFRSRIDEWREQGLHLYFLPPYSPELTSDPDCLATDQAALDLTRRLHVARTSLE